MAMGRRKRHRQRALFVEANRLARGPGHPFYRRLNQLLDKHDFDDFVEGECAQYYADQVGRPSLAPAVYFRLLLIGYFEGVDSERGIAWRVADSISLREFLGFELSDSTPDHSTISRNRRLISLESHQEVFAWVLRMLAKSGLLRAKTLGIDATTLEANAALRSIVRRDSGERYDEFLERLAKDSGIETPTRSALAKLDRKRPGKGKNDDWKNPHDPDAKITKMKDGRTRLAHKVEHAVDMDSGAVVAVTVHGGCDGDSQSFEATLEEPSRPWERWPPILVLLRVSTRLRSPRSSPTRATTPTRSCGAVVSEASAPTSPSRIVGVATGRARLPSRQRPMPIAAVSEASAARRCCANGVRSWNADSRMATRQGTSAGPTCAATGTFGSGF